MAKILQSTVSSMDGYSGQQSTCITEVVHEVPNTLNSNAHSQQGGGKD